LDGSQRLTTVALLDANVDVILQTWLVMEQTEGCSGGDLRHRSLKYSRRQYQRKDQTFGDFGSQNLLHQVSHRPGKQKEEGGKEKRGDMTCRKGREGHLHIQL
jgi:hypothetical protein